MPKSARRHRSGWGRSWQTDHLPGIIAILLFTLWLYIPPYWNSFVGDDFVQQWRIREFLDQPFAAYRIFGPFWTDWYYRPLQNLWFLVNRLVFGLKPFAYYYLQVSLHLISISLLFQLARRLKVGVLGAFVAAALFALNAEHQLTVSWISSIGIVLALTLSLAAVSLLLAYLRQPSRVGLLTLVLLAAALTLLAQEEGILLPVILVAVWWSDAGLRRPRPAETVAGLGLAAISFTYVAFQLIRPNANLSVGGAFFPNVLSNLSPVAIGRFAQDLLSRWLLLEDTSLGQSAIELAGRSPIWPLLILVLIGGPIILWFRWGNRPVRLGLLWTVLHVGFIYVVVYSQRPELFDSRHLYQAWAGLSLAVGATIGRVVGSTGRSPVRRRLTSQPGRWVIAALALVIVLQGTQVRRHHQRILGLTREVQSAELQMRSILPSISDDTRVFATRFILTPSYFVPVVAVWYDQPHLAGGDLDTLAEYARATSDFHVFDYDNRRLYELMPELQQHRSTVFIWRQPPAVAQLAREGQPTTLDPGEYELNAIIASNEDRRLAMAMPAYPGAWTTLAFDLERPSASRLAFSIHGRVGDIFRVGLEDRSGQLMTLFEQELTGGSAGRWQDVTLPLPDNATGQVRLFFDIRGADDAEEGTGYWADPRFVTD